MGIKADFGEIVVDELLRAGPALAENDRLAEQLAPQNAAGAQRRKAGRVGRDHHEMVLGDRLVNKVLPVVGAADKGELHIAVEQQLLHRGAVAARERAAAVRPRLGEGGHIVRQKALRGYGGGAQRQLACRIAHHVGAQGAAAGEDLLCVVVDAPPIGGERQLALGYAAQQHRAERLLQRLHIAADGRLGEEELFGGGGEAAAVHNGDKNFQLAEIDVVHVRSLPCPILSLCIVENTEGFVKPFHGKVRRYHRENG